jgi:hypothetical protein
VTPEEYQAEQALITALAARYVASLGSNFIVPRIGLREWLDFLKLLFPEVQYRRSEAAELARRFYDSQRLEYVPDLLRNDVDLEGTSFEEFVRQMEPARKKMSVANSPQDALTRTILQVTREIENAGRRQIIHAVNTDADLVQRLIEQEQREAARAAAAEATIPQLPGGARVVRGWARVATGLETCAWCLMLVSRGPVYYEADRAGLTYDEQLAQSLYKKTSPDLDSYFDEINDFMEEWHPGCDCKVVPVFKAEEWPGRAMQKQAEDLWVRATEEAKRYRRENPDRVHLAGKNKGEKFTLNQDTVEALRRMINRGEVNFTQLALAS